MGKRLGWLIAIGIGLSSALAHASDPPDPARDAEARRMFEGGREAYEAGNYQQGLYYFERAYELSARPGLLFNIGQAAYRMRSDQRALQAFKAYLDQNPTAPNRLEVEQRIRELELGTAAPTTPTYVSPERTARDAAPALWGWPQTNDTIDKPPPTSKPVTKQWWFWTTIGVIVVGGTVAAIVVAT
ncbi:MAG TPA: tetratricopeptide repeat protein [Polyangiales bacterium]|nr:tetratricopeptide repeat protein [Polyangiales bacterium]